jgi:hypothetical protein
LAINPNFGIALGNRGYGLVQYARSLYDPGHKRVFFHFAYRDLKAAISSKARYGGYKQEDANGGLPASDIASGSIVSLMNPETPDPADINASPAASACFLLFGSGFALSSTHDPRPRSFLPTWRV